MLIGVLGPLRLQQQTGEQELGSPKQRALLAALVLHANRLVAADTLIDLVWGERPPAAAKASLHTYVAMLRRTLEPDRRARARPSVLLTTAGGYELRVEPDTVDDQRFSTLVQRVHRQLDPAGPLAVPGALTAGELDRSADALAEALAWWRGEPYAELGERTAATAERTRLHDLRLAAIADRARIQLALGRSGVVATDIGPVAADHPLREDLWALLALALARAGRQSEALHTLRTVRELLDAELGIDPSPVVRDLEVAVLRQQVDQAPPPPVTSRSHTAVAAVHIDDTVPRTQPDDAADVPGTEQSAEPSAESVGFDGPPRAADAPFVGRDDEFAALVGLLDQVAGGSARSAVLIGEPGIGKTRLTEEFAARATALGFRVHVGRCSADEGSPPLWPWVAVLRSLSEERPSEEPADQRLIDLLGLLEWRARPSTNPLSASDRFTQFDAVAEVLSDAAARHPRVLIMDDLHWADPSTLRLLSHVTATIDRARLMVVSTRRAHPAPSGALADYGEALARRHALRLELSGLSVDDVGELAIAGHAGALPVGSAAALRARTGGNPFFLLELLRVDRTEGGPEVVPAGVADVIRARVGRLPAPTRQALRSAAAVGTTVDPELLALLEGSSIDGTLDALEPAVEVGLLAVTADGVLRFAHDLLRDAVEAADTPLRRQRRHAAIAATLSERGMSGRHLAEIARHWLQAGPRHAARAWPAAVAAAEYATGLAAYEEAADLLAAAGTAQTLDSAASPIDRYDLLMTRAQACRAAADNGGQRIATTEAIEIARRVGDLGRAANAAIAAAEGGLWSNVPEGTQHAVTVEALRTAARDLPDGDSALRCRVFLALSRELFWSMTEIGGHPHPAEREAYAERGFAMARRLADPRLQAAACHTLSLALIRPATLERRVELAQEAVDCSRVAGDPEGEAVGLFWRVVFAGEAGRVADRRIAVRSAQEHVERHGLRMLQVMLGANQASWLALEGRFDDADALLEDSERRTTLASFPFRDEAVTATRAFVQLWRGHPEATLALFGALEVVGQTDLDTVVILAMLRGGLLADAAQRLDNAHALPLSADTFAAPFDLSILAEAALLLGRRDLAATVYPVLRPWVGRVAAAGTGPPLGPIDAFLALAAAAVGEVDLASGHADDAHRLCDEWGMPVVASWLSGLRNRFGF